MNEPLKKIMFRNNLPRMGRLLLVQYLGPILLEAGLEASLAKQGHFSSWIIA
jgi:hypothetical protein